MYNWDKKKLPSRFESCFTLANDIHNYNTSNLSNVCRSYSKSVTVLNSVRYIRPQFWNTLPSDIKHASSIQPFKNFLKKHFIRRFKYELGLYLWLHVYACKYEFICMCRCIWKYVLLVSFVRLLLFFFVLISFVL